MVSENNTNLYGRQIYLFLRYFNFYTNHEYVKYYNLKMPMHNREMYLW